MDWRTVAVSAVISVIAALLLGRGKASSGTPDARVAELERRISALEARLSSQSTVIAGGNSVPDGRPQDDEILREIRAGRKINAIKLYRERTGVGLQGAKEAVEAMERGL